MNMDAEPVPVPEEFVKITKDFVRDIQITFPEYESLIQKWWKMNDAGDLENSSALFLFSFCKKKYAPRFFDILYQNGDIFKEDSDIDTEFLPYIHFKNLWNCELSDKTRDTIWKYLQLILFSVVGSIEKQEEFGDTAKLFEAINDEDFKSKLEETIGQMQGLFGATSENLGMDMSLGNPDSHFNMEHMPNAEELHEHISGMLDGKIGKLAKEIAEETAQNLNVDLENVTDMKDLFNKLIKNPTKLMGLVKNIGDKIDERMKSGELKESELMSEASEIMQKMKNMPGMQSMLSKMAGMGGKGKMNMGAMEAQLNRNMKAAQMKERMKTKAEKKQQTQPSQMQHPSQSQNQTQTQSNTISEEQIISIFSTGEVVEKTPRGAKPVENITGSSSGKSKNKKQKKAK